MALSPHQIFGRLQELKKWQQTHEKLLQRSGTDEELRRASLNNQYSSHSPENVRENIFENGEQLQLQSQSNLEDDYIRTSFEKDFEILLEEKLKENTEYNVPMNNTSLPKRPFLKKGTGLLKYNLKPEEYKNLIGNKYSNSVLVKKNRSKSAETKKKTVQFQTERPRTTGNAPKTCTKRTQNIVKPCRTSVAASVHKPRISGIDYSRRNEIQNRQNKNKIMENSSQLQRVPNEKKSNRGGDCSSERSHFIKNNVRFHPEEPKYGGNTDNDVEKIKPNLHQAHLPAKELENDKFASSKKCSPKLHDFMENIVNKPVEYTPLKVPEISIKSKGSWCDVNFQNDTWKNLNGNNLKKDDIVISNDRYAAQVSVNSHWKNGYVNEVNGKENSMPEIESIGDIKERINPPSRKTLSYTSNDNSLYERALETELKIFEALERRTEQSSFCSTNTSIIQLLASTPSKLNFKNNEMNTPDHVLKKIPDVVEDEDNLPVRENEVHEFEDELLNYENNLQRTHFQNLASQKWKSERDPHLEKPELEESEDTETEEETDTTMEEDTNLVASKYSDDYFKHRRDSSTNTDDLLALPSSYSSTNSDISEDYMAELSKAYSTSKSSTNSKILNSSESCTSCGFLIKDKIEECQRELDILITEKNRIVAIREQMDKDKEEFEKEMKLRRIQFEEQKLRYQLEIEEERKKITEKSASEKPNKDTISKAQHRKDRDEINNLKMELSEAKELLKLRDTKNAMSLARLRNQLKVLEKNNSELKMENEKLIKEKSKLVAQQKNLNKNTETKMLKEISKNISKLTEETFKNQTFKVDSSSEDNMKMKSIKGIGGECRQNVRKSSNSSQGILKKSTQPYHAQGEEPIEDYPVERTSPTVVDNIEEKYESLFGGNYVIIEENTKNPSYSSGNTTKSLGLGKTEKILEDGTKEMKYSNGNVKLISENGTVRYYYSSNDTWHTNFPDGTEVIEFSNGQSEKRFKDGKCLIFFPDGLIQTIFPDGTEEVKYPDGSKLLTKKNGDRMLFLPNGQVEIHTKEQKRREYPDGTVKILYPDGSQETRYSNGRVRMKNSKGDIVLDTGEVSG